jgi:hypothetical protein
MATPGELAKVAAAVLGLPEVQVLSTHRALRQADLVSKHGRGLAAAKMTPTDAAMLLVALLGSNQIVNSAATIRRYEKATPFHESTKTLFEHVRIPALANLPADHSFLNALTALIAASTDGTLLAGLHLMYPWNSIEVTVQSPPTIADIRILGPERGTSASIRYSASGAIERSGDLDEYRRVSAKTIIYLGAALAGKLDELPAPGPEGPRP